MPYIHFTEEQKLRASEVDLVEFLRRQGEKLIPSGVEYRMSSDHSVTVRGNEWYDHAVKQGGGPVSFVQQFYNLSYPEAVTRLLDGEQGCIYTAAPKQEEKPKEEFALPPANRDMRRVYAYLLNRRFLDRDVVSAFVRAGLLYESCEISKDRTREYHNAVFVGKDEDGVPRHAHKRSVNDIGRTFRINVEGSDPRCSFHYTGTSNRLYVFEAPIDLLSFLTRYPRGWQEHSYVSLCGTSEHAMLWMLEQDPSLRTICLCLDHDAAGIEASGRLTEILHEHGYDEVGVIQPEHKDWNEDLKARRGLPAQDSEEHPQLITASEICDLLSELAGHDVVFTLRALPYGKTHDLARFTQDADVNILLAGCAEPDLKDPRLMEKFGGATPAEAVKRMLLPGEIADLGMAVEKLSGYRRVTITEVKNG